MKTVIGVRLRRPGKIYYFNPGNKKINKGEFVIVETTFGQEYAEVIMGNKEIPDEKIVTPLKDIIRIANAKDKEQNEINRKKEKEAWSAEKAGCRSRCGTLFRNLCGSGFLCGAFHYGLAGRRKEGQRCGAGACRDSQYRCQWDDGRQCEPDYDCYVGCHRCGGTCHADDRIHYQYVYRADKLFRTEAGEFQ